MGLPQLRPEETASHDLVFQRYYGPEFRGQARDAWAYARGVQLRFIRPGKPIENACVESFNG